MRAFLTSSVKRTFRVGLLGSGYIADWHLQALRRAEQRRGRCAVRHRPWACQVACRRPRNRRQLCKFGRYGRGSPVGRRPRAYASRFALRYGAVRARGRSARAAREAAVRPPRRVRTAGAARQRTATIALRKPQFLVRRRIRAIAGRCSCGTPRSDRPCEHRLEQAVRPTGRRAVRRVDAAAAGKHYFRNRCAFARASFGLV